MEHPLQDMKTKRDKLSCNDKVQHWSTGLMWKKHPSIRCLNKIQSFVLVNDFPLRFLSDTQARKKKYIFLLVAISSNRANPDGLLHKIILEVLNGDRFKKGQALKKGQVIFEFG